MNDVITPNQAPSSRRSSQYRMREHMAQQPRPVSLRDLCCSEKDDNPVTPPSISKRHPILGSSNPPSVPRHERPINRRLLLQEAQERLSLPNLFAPRGTASSRRRLRGSPQRPSLIPIEPRVGSWSDYCYDHEPPVSQRSFFCNMTDL